MQNFTILCGQQYNFTNYSVKDGLVQSNVHAMIEDHNGLLWFATAGGISIFDGVEFTSITQKDGLPSNNVDDLQLDNNNNIWGLPRKGNIFCIKGDTVIVYGDKQGLYGNQFYNLFIDSSNNIWCTSEKGIFYKAIDRDTFEMIESKQLRGQKNLNIYEAEKGTIWFAYPHTLVKLKHRKLSFYPLYNKAPFFKMGLFYDSKKRLWVQTDRSIFLLPHNKGNLKLFYSGVSYLRKSSNSLIEDKNGVLWFVLGDGIYCIDSDSTNTPRPFKKLDIKYVLAIFIDNQGNLWFGTPEGLYHYDHNKLTLFSNHNGLKNSLIDYIIQDRQGVLWIGAGTSISKFEGFRFKHILENLELDNGHVTAIFEDKSKNIWLGNLHESYKVSGDSYSNIEKNQIDTLGRVFGIFSSQKDLFFYGSHGLLKISNGSVVHLLKDRFITSHYIEDDGSILFGKINGIFRFKNNEIVYEDNTTLQYDNSVNGIIKDSTGLFWLGARHGVYQFDGKKIIPFRPEDPHFQEWCVSMTTDKKNGLWVSSNKGISLIKADSIYKFGIKDGLNSINIFALFVDKENHLWIGTNKGLDRIDLNEFYRTNAFNVTHYGYAEGYRGVETNLNAIHQDHQGQLWFGHLDGVTIYDPKHDNRDLYPKAKIFISKVNIFSNRADMKKYSDSINAFTKLPMNLTLPHDQNDITFSYKAVSTRNASNVKYQYRLLGLNDDWKPHTKESQANYINLPSGDYTFQVRTAPERGNEEDTAIAAFSFSIKKPFWKMNGFIAGALIIFALLAYLFWKTRMNIAKNRLKLANMRQMALGSNMNPHFIFNSMNSIQRYIATDQKHMANMYLAKFGLLMRKVLDHTQRSYVSIEQEVELLNLYLELECRRKKNNFIYNIELAEPMNSIDLSIPPMLIQPFLENSIWHGLIETSKKGHVKVIFDMIDRFKLKCEVIDNGIGIEKSMAKKNEKHRSKGIMLIKERLQTYGKIHHRDYQVTVKDLSRENEKKTGTCVSLEIPYKIKY